MFAAADRQEVRAIIIAVIAGLDPAIHATSQFGETNHGLPGHAAELVIGPRFARTRWRRPSNDG